MHEDNCRDVIVPFTLKMISTHLIHEVICLGCWNISNADIFDNWSWSWLKFAEKLRRFGANDQQAQNRQKNEPNGIIDISFSFKFTASTLTSS